MTLSAILFYILATLTGISAIAVVLTQNIVRAATWLLFALAGTSGIFFLLGADFVGATQLLIYVGGTLVLVVFGVMLTAQGPFINMRIGAAEWAISVAVGLLLYGVLAYCLWGVHAPAKNMLSTAIYSSSKQSPTTKQDGKEAQTPRKEPTQAEHEANLVAEDRSLAPSKSLGAVLLGDTRSTPDGFETGFSGTRERSKMNYLLPFEIVSIHLLVVLIGAAYLARAKKRIKASQERVVTPLARQSGATTVALTSSSYPQSITGAGSHG